MIDNKDYKTEEFDTIDIPMKKEKNNDKNNDNHIDKKDSKKKKSAKEISLMKIWDILLIIIYIGCASLLTYFIWNFHILPENWLYILIGIQSILLLIFIILSILKLRVWGIWLKRVFIILLSIALGVGSFYVKSVYDTLSAITKPETDTLINISIITKKDNDIRSLEDLKDKKIGLQNGNDKENANFVREQLKTRPEVSQVTYEESLDYTTLYNDMLAGKVDAMIITNSYMNLLKNNFANMDEEIKVVEVFQNERKDEVSTSDKDIRYDTFTFMITGIDSTNDPNENSSSDLSDVNMLLIVNPQANKIQMVSFPRDAYIPNPALGYENDKLTHTGNHGPENTVKAIENLTGLDIDFYAKVSFTSIIEIVDALGGIECDVELAFEEQDENRSFAEDDLIRLEAGMQHLNGKQSLAYARHRHTEGYGDIGRTRAQQRVIQGIINRMTSAEGVTKINAVLKVAQKYVATNMPMEQVTNFISYQLDRIKPWSMDSFTVDAYGDMLTTASMGAMELSVQVLDKASVQKILDAYQQMDGQMKFNEFSFDLNDLEKDRLLLKNNKILWSGMNTGQYKAPETDYSQQNNTDNPVVPPVVDPKPDPDPEFTPPTGGGSSEEDDPKPKPPVEDPKPPVEEEKPDPDPKPDNPKPEKPKP